MRWKLVLLLGLLASGAAAAALVRAQEDPLRASAFGDASAYRPRTASPPADAGSQLRTSSRSGGLVGRLQEIRQSVVDDYNTPDAAPELLEPAPEASATPSAQVTGAAVPPTPGLPSVLRRTNSATGEASAVRSAALDEAASSRTSAPARTASRPATGALPPPSGARPLGALPTGARPLGQLPPGASPLQTATEEAPRSDEAFKPSAPTTSNGETPEGEASSSRRRAPPTVTPSATLSSDIAPAQAPKVAQRTDTPAFRPTTTGGREVILLGPGPQLRLEAIGPKAAVRGRPASYTMAISNHGEASARGVQVQIASPPSVQLGVGKATHGAAELHRGPTGAPVLVWSISELPRGAKAELIVTAVPQETQPFELTASWTTAPQSAGAQVEVLEPQLAMTLSGPKDVMFGETKIYTITLTNPGTGDAENVLLALAPLSSGQEAPQARNIGVLRAGERKEIPIQLTAREAGLLQLRAEVSADGGLRAEAAEQVMVRRGQLEVTVEGPPLKYAGSPAEYRVRVANVGNAAAEEVALGVALPDGVEYMEGDDGGAVQSGGVAWRIGSLAPGDERTFAFTCNMNDEGEKRLSFQARGAGDLQATTTAATSVEALADLKLVVNDPPGPIAVGKEVTYEVRIRNRGTKAAAGIEIAAYFSEGIEPTAIEGAQGELGAGQVVAAPIASLDAGAEIVVKIRAKADQPGNHIFRAVVQCANPETRLATEETTRFFGNAPAGAEAPNLSRQPSPFQPQAR